MSYGSGKQEQSRKDPPNEAQLNGVAKMPVWELCQKL